MELEILFLGALVVIMIVRCMAVTIPLAMDRRGTRAIRQLCGLGGDEDDATRMRDILEQALAESRNDAEFEESYRRIVAIPELVHSPFSWYSLCYTLLEYQRGGEVVLAPRTCAKRYLEDISRTLVKSTPLLS